ncbi:MAG: hypothetical protein HGA78_02710 [Nitrospirales bacterium]|nr:hypothetical protein [Nitrospirales bacterium]
MIELTKTKGLRGEVSVPPDKSISHRAVMFGGLAEGRSVVRNFLRAEDPLSTMHAFRMLHARINLRDAGAGGCHLRVAIVKGVLGPEQARVIRRIEVLHGPKRGEFHMGHEKKQDTDGGETQDVEARLPLRFSVLRHDHTPPRASP